VFEYASVLESNGM